MLLPYLTVIRIDGDIWNVRFQFYGRDNLNGTMTRSAIIYNNMLAIMDMKDFGTTNYIYYVKQEGTCIADIEFLDNTTMVEEMCNEFEHNKCVKFIVLKGHAQIHLMLTKLHRCVSNKSP